MKSTKSFHVPVNVRLSHAVRPVLALLLAIVIGYVQGVACGPFMPIIPTPEFFALKGDPRPMSYYQRNENLELWQAQTSREIPLGDIEEVVYDDSLDSFNEYTGRRPEKTDNQFYAYLNSPKGKDAAEFLRTAKTLERLWAEIRSPWYYSKEHGTVIEPERFNQIIDKCRQYRGTQMRDRYALQITRALFASRQYQRCIEYSDSAFAVIPDDNLMKRMARGYEAGCQRRLGDTHDADLYFAEAGDIFSIQNANPAGYMARINPDAPQFIDYARHYAHDDTVMRDIAAIARRLVYDDRVTCKGDWYFMLAYTDNEFNGDASAAADEIHAAMRHYFSSSELRDLARAYKMKFDVRNGDTGTLLDDLKWLEQKSGILNADAGEWVRRTRNIIYADWVPQLWQQKQYGLAILLCSYADNLDTSVWDEVWDAPGLFGFPVAVRHTDFSETRDSEILDNRLDYGCLSFQLMGSLTSAQLADAYDHIMTDTPLNVFLRRLARTDRDYYNEVIGTLALREEEYSRAVDYLSQVSVHYLRTMNLDKDGYFSHDPFAHYASRWYTGYYDKEDSDETGALQYEPDGFDYECGVASHRYVSNPNAKLDFARKMLAYKEQMTSAPTADERGLARLMYAIGRFNSFEECWPLTQYWRGMCDNIFEPELQYWEFDFGPKYYAFLYDYRTTVGHRATERIYNAERTAALAMLTTDEARAQANYILGNLATIVRQYPHTATARYIHSHCDNWRSWL